jgi:hypothetical protein
MSESPAESHRILIYNEQLKLLASWLDRASTALITTGIITPIIGIFYNGTAPAVGIWAIAGITYTSLSLAFNLHLLARTVLKRLKL